MSSNSVISIFNHTCYFLELRARSHLFMVLLPYKYPLNYMIFFLISIPKLYGILIDTPSFSVSSI